ncbi:MAG: cytochrome c oxidase subunit 2 [Candidatus Latescibacterota bacterium]|jgi:cytochrome c oxidase subunit 2
MKWNAGIGIWILCLLGFVALASADPGDAKKGKMGFMVCVACHGAQAEGNKLLNSPRLAGQEDWYIKSQLFKFKQGIRGADAKDLFGMQMVPMAKILADEKAIDDVIAYIKTLKTDLPTDPSSGDPAKGQVLYQVCMACHGDKAQGNVEQKAPRLGDQHAWYMARQLKNFRDGIRGAHPQDTEGLLMRPMSMTLVDDQAIEDVIAYIESLKFNGAK